MAEKMLVTQALDERDLLKKKIFDKIENASFVDVKKNNEEKVYCARVEEKDFVKEAKASFQQISDLINRYNRVDAAIIESNANTQIETSYGKYTVAAAIALKNRMSRRDHFSPNTFLQDFEISLESKMHEELANMIKMAEEKNRDLASTAENMRLSILGKDSKVKDDKPLLVVDAYVKENTTELVDPLGAEKKLEELKEKRDKLLSELETQIKVSNATTFVEF